MAFITNSDKLSFREIVLGHLKHILELSTREFTRDYKRTVYSGNGSTEIITEDNRKCYVQAVENLATVLIPYFDKTMTEKYNELCPLLEMTNYEFSSEYEKDYVKIHKDVDKFNSNPKSISYSWIEGIFILFKLKNARILFKELNFLLKRVDYLKGSIYGEGESEGEEDE